MKIDSHKNVKVNISKTKSKFNGVKHKKEKVTYKNVPYWHYTSQKQYHLLGSNENHLQRLLGIFELGVLTIN